MKLLVTFSRKGGREPVIARTVKETGVLINVERANIDSMAGEVLVDVPDTDADLVCRKMRETGASVRILEESVLRDVDECIDCGACISICPQDVFSFDGEWRLVLDGSRCVLCGKCIPACPHHALSLLS
ncbi:MAG: 4Fe-4S dicluster domain-containing protein [Methanomicrobiales archaeon]|nr:4Fe-4S dicluster domain-containing protein [Methanomicrobiales archaeon]